MERREAFVLAVMDGAGGCVEGRTRLEKLVFLAQEAAEVSYFEFEAREYGPFSAGVVEAVDGAVAAGRVVRERERLNGGWKYEYAVTARGREALAGRQEVVDAARETGELYGGVPIGRLLEVVYNRYPGYTGESVI